MTLRQTARAIAMRERKTRATESAQRMQAQQDETRRIVATGVCPRCGSALRNNLALTGWWQCAQLGADTHRADATKPACAWQGFT